ncbi:aspartyl-phosphate phosphatase Spo0E family protein [Desulfosporosinus sp. Sb-LF]|uniref:aspartyl-phosphate phosphatase Spo0E family protein n=1 Tax=Desulfosporosinus sp. Sb-LF TaxID=2560027 RepID=UPI00107F2D0F|nr:aspartyl-phosphate phosphatase Spo0E family protein [Desulfosporosinus sp. Sb-LF]TGE34474.1 aspartyl-phosphate phosphatase Spo0E family protein [Desulfosporosinus sp. Sb-LF]
MSELEGLIKQIEGLRLSMIKVKEGKSHTDSEVVAACQELDAALDRYQGILMRMKKSGKF